jgi:outer membrane protein assembly factor BamB
MRLSTPALRLVGTLAILLPALAAADWNQWRGPNRDGTFSGATLPAAWKPDSLAKQWRLTVGEGHASPVIAGDRVYVFAREDDQEVMRCLSLADGKLLWRDAYAAPYEMHPAARGHGKGPKATPAVAGGRVFALGIDGHVSAYDAASGRVLWRKEFSRDFKSTSPAFGAAASPLVDGDRVYIHVGGRNNGAFTAFDTATGRILWQWNGDGPGYSSPVIGTFGGVRHLITQSQEHCIALSPDDGRLLWQVPFATPYEQNSVTPVIVGNRVVFAGLQKPTFALEVTGRGEPRQVWETNELTKYKSTHVLDGDTLYGMSNKQRGSLFALDAQNGDVRWKGEGRLGENASLTDLGPVVLVVTDKGELTVHRKSGTALQKLARYQVADEPVWASPAVSRDGLLIKDKTSLAFFRFVGPS